MDKLSYTQENIIKEMLNKDLYLATNEGKVLRCWLEDKNGNFVKVVRISTIIVLANKKLIIPLEDNKYKDNRNVFLWKLNVNNYILKGLMR